jgi:phenylalanyl-tRNA synthetase beta chain
MYASEAWINDYLDRPADAEEQADLLTHAGFPLEGREDLPDDVRQDFEMTSNRGDCTCHVGLAREIAALSDRTLFIPVAAPETSGPAADTFASITNEVPQHCRRYTGRIITGITVGPSPTHISERLTARGDIPRSNLVDATNFVLFELGQPTHVFDLDTLAGGQIIVRMARKGEKFLPIGEDASEIELDGTELVIADAEKPIALAGVKGGALTAVTEATKNILVEAATFDPVMVRHTSRLHTISSDSSFRFERGVSPGQIDEAAERLCQLILDSAGGSLAPGVLTSGTELPARAVVTMRTARCRSLLGLSIDDDTQTAMLEGLGFEPSLADGLITATVPWHRGDIHREVDLIEEVMRMHGFAAVPVRGTLTITPAVDPPDHHATEALTAALVADGFVETVTHTLIGEQDAAPFLPAGCTARHVHEARAAGEPVLRPSIIPSLLRVRRHNADQGVEDLSLFELGSTFHHAADGADIETLELGLLMDIRTASDGIRPLRGVVDHVARAIAGMDAAVTVEPCDDLPWLAPAATISINDRCVGHIGRLSPAVSPCEGSWLAATIKPEAFTQAEVAERSAHRLPDHPAIERDLSLIVPEAITWNQLASIARGLDMPHHEATEFVTVYRGKGIPEGQKSVSMRLRFRAGDRTLTREEIEGPLESLLATFRADVGAEIRG